MGYKLIKDLIQSALIFWKPSVLLIVCILAGQPFAKGQNGYTLVGSARSDKTADCVQLTNSSNSQKGAVWFDKRLDLNKSFELDFIINLGDNPAGADGEVMVFQTQGNQVVGSDAGGIGYEGIRPSLGIEFDTNQNFGDPPEDHIALVRDGVSDHRLNTGFAAPVPISTTQNTVKDGRDHYVKVLWDASSQVLRVEVDCVQRISESIDLVNAIFSGTSDVIWGFTSTTGARGNVHTVCLPKKEVQPDTIQACRNDQIALMSPLSSNGQYKWTPTTNLENSQTRNPRLRVSNSQLYTVQYTDRCGQPKLDTIFVKAKGVALFIGADRQVCENDSVMLLPELTPATVPVTYQWSTGQTTSQLNPTTSGQYSLTITADGCSVSDSASVTFIPLPKLSLPTEPVYDCPGSQSIQLDPGATGSNLQYFWTPGSSKEPVLVVNSPGLYTVQITAGTNCSSAQRFTVLNNCPSIAVFVPDAFTPNDDGTNDVLTWKGERDLEVRMKVFDRWGEVLFVSTASSPYWDGTYQGKPCVSATYTWSLEYRSRLALTQPGFTMHGIVLLLK